MRQNGYMQPLRSPHGGVTCIAAFGKNEIRRLLFKDVQRLSLCGKKAEGDGKIFRRERAHELGAVYKMVRTAEGGDKTAFNAVSVIDPDSISTATGPIFSDTGATARSGDERRMAIKRHLSMALF